MIHVYLAFPMQIINVSSINRPQLWMNNKMNEHFMKALWNKQNHDGLKKQLRL